MVIENNISYILLLSSFVCFDIILIINGTVFRGVSSFATWVSTSIFYFYVLVMVKYVSYLNQTVNFVLSGNKRTSTTFSDVFLIPIHLIMSRHKALTVKQ